MHYNHFYEIPRAGAFPLFPRLFLPLTYVAYRIHDPVNQASFATPFRPLYWVNLLFTLRLVDPKPKPLQRRLHLLKRGLRLRPRDSKHMIRGDGPEATHHRVCRVLLHPHFPLRLRRLHRYLESRNVLLFVVDIWCSLSPSKQIWAPYRSGETASSGTRPR